MGNISNYVQYLPSERKYILVDDSELYDNFEQIVDEEVSKIDSYQKLTQLKRSIDSLIEILYSNASFCDIDTELETTKHTQAKLESQKRVQDKKRKIIESIITYVAMQQQEADGNASNLNHIEKENTDIDEVKNKLKLQVKEVLFAVLANRMDPEKRAGETESSNAKDAKRYGREDEDHKQQSNIFSSLLKLLLNVLLGINVDIFPNRSFTAKIKAENQNKKGMSI
ncbi:MAG: hypothetical protein sL5_01210 [Candidatus Mesenet longicola]|uniref:Uncharacterized protein n=1 Tax=Candidatus Mesenet longicola TaxID=1892558 RepID=A0A8J3HP62_9RICK|nr:MAG: hypothetical protein sGL2_01150 [Candidatus Mesenet longicola]GHM59128.1 MAG: hypothetical protein sL5_01210 [Candidatus Mesenet longicola]